MVAVNRCHLKGTQIQKLKGRTNKNTKNEGKKCQLLVATLWEVTKLKKNIVCEMTVVNGCFLRSNIFVEKCCLWKGSH